MPQALIARRRQLAIELAYAVFKRLIGSGKVLGQLAEQTEGPIEIGRPGRLQLRHVRSLLRGLKSSGGRRFSPTRPDDPGARTVPVKLLYEKRGVINGGQQPRQNPGGNHRRARHISVASRPAW